MSGSQCSLLGPPLGEAERIKRQTSKFLHTTAAPSTFITLIYTYFVLTFTINIIKFIVKIIETTDGPIQLKITTI